MINQNWLHTFCVLSETGHFTRTAEKLFMTQSGVSQHIKKLEQQLATPLLIREGKSFTLTEAGNQLYLKGQMLLHAFEELEHTIKQDSPYEGRVKIASPGSVGLKLYPHLLQLQQQHTKLVIDYGFSPNRSIEQSIIDRLCDIGLMTEPTQSAAIVSQVIATEPLVVITPSEITQINWQALLQLGFVAHPDAAHHCRLLLSPNFNEFEHIEQFIHKGFSNQIGLILEPVSMGLGFTVLPLHAATAFYDQSKIRIHHLNVSVSEPLYLCHHRHGQESRRAEYIKTAISEYLAR